MTVEALAARLKAEPEPVFHILRRLAANGRGVVVERPADGDLTRALWGSGSNT